MLKVLYQLFIMEGAMKQESVASFFALLYWLGVAAVLAIGVASVLVTKAMNVPPLTAFVHSGRFVTLLVVIGIIAVISAFIGLLLGRSPDTA